jgi:hypothetical protein
MGDAVAMKERRRKLSFFFFDAKLSLFHLAVGCDRHSRRYFRVSAVIAAAN